MGALPAPHDKIKIPPVALRISVVVIHETHYELEIKLLVALYHRQLALVSSEW